MGLSSGTTGNNKMYPYTTVGFSRMITCFLASMYNLPFRKDLPRVFQLRIFHRPKTSEAGIKLGGIASYVSPIMFFNVGPR